MATLRLILTFIAGYGVVAWLGYSFVWSIAAGVLVVLGFELYLTFIWMRYHAHQLVFQLSMAIDWSRWRLILQASSIDRSFVLRRERYPGIEPSVVTTVQQIIRLLEHYSVDDLFTTPTGLSAIASELGQLPDLPLSKAVSGIEKQAAVNRLVDAIMGDVQRGQASAVASGLGGSGPGGSGPGGSELDELENMAEAADRDGDTHLALYIRYHLAEIYLNLRTQDSRARSEQIGIEILDLWKAHKITPEPQDYVQAKSNLGQAIAARGAFLDEEVERLDIAASHIDEALQKASHLDHPVLVARTAVQFGSVLLDFSVKTQANTDRAIKYADIALKQLRAVDDNDLVRIFRGLALWIKAQSYLIMRQLPNADEEEAASKAAQLFHEASTTLDPSHELQAATRVYRGTALVFLSRYRPEVFDEGIRLIREGDQMGIAGRNQVLAWTVVSNALYSVDRFEEARHYLEYVIDIAESELLLNDAERLAFLPTLHLVTDQIAHIEITCGELSKAVRHLEMGRTRFFRRTAFSDETWERIARNTLGAGVTPIYLTLSSKGIGAVALSLDSIRGLESIVYEQVEIDNRDDFKKLLDLERAARRPWASTEAFEFIVRPLRDFMADRKIRRVVLVVTSPLTMLPIHVALLDDAVVSFLPALLTLSTTASANDDEAPSPAGLVIGTDAPDLTMAPVEAKKVATMLSGDVILKEHGEVTFDELLELLHRVNQLHFAGHGSFTPGDPMASALHFAKGVSVSMLDIYEAGRSNREAHCEHVFLSACNSSQSDQMWLKNEGASIALSALSAFGARAVIGSLWPVADLFALLFVSKYYARLKDVRDSATTLRDTQRWFRDLDHPTLVDELRRDELWADLDRSAAEFLSSPGGAQVFAQRDRTWMAFTVTGVPELDRMRTAAELESSDAVR